jgi:hypothetical protein
MFSDPAMEKTMAAVQRASRVESQQIDETGESPVIRLARLHDEAQDTARLANLLGRSLHAAVALVLMGTATLVLGGAALAESATWAVFVLAAAGAVLFAYSRTIRQPFERAALKSFSRDLNAILVFAGFAWGAGAFLTLPATASVAAIVLFSAGAGAVIALLLREQECAFLFLAPIAFLTSFACVLRPISGGALDTSVVLIACSLVAGGIALAARHRPAAAGIPELAGLPSA